MRENVIKKIRLDSSEYWCNSGASYYLVKIDHSNHTMQWESLGGAAPDWDSFLNFCLSDRDMKIELKWAMNKYERKYPILVKEREGMSGCKDITLYISKARHRWAITSAAKKVLSLHISCAWKLNEGIPDMFVGDLLDVISYMYSGLDKKIFKRNSYKYMRPTKRPPQKIESVCGKMDTSMSLYEWK